MGATRTTGGTNKAGYTPKIAGRARERRDVDAAAADGAVGVAGVGLATSRAVAPPEDPATASVVEATGVSAPTAATQATDITRALELPDSPAAEQPASGASEVGASEDGAPVEEQSESVKAARRRMLTLALAVATVVLAVIAVVLALHPGARHSTDRAFVDRAATTDLASQAQTDICSAVAPDGTQVDKWAAGARAALTGRALKEFDAYLPAQRSVLEQTKSVAACRAQAVGIRELHGDSAVVDVSLLLSESVNGTATNSGTSGNRLTMVKHGDRWLVSAVAPI